MAVRVEFEGYINDIRQYDWGVVYNIAHKQVQKSAGGSWETVGYDYFSVTGQPGFEKDQKVRVTGTLKSKRYEKKDGSGSAVALNVRAETMDKVEYENKPASVPDMQQIWPDVKQIPEDTPF